MISPYLTGRLGNNLFQYIFCRIAASNLNCNYYIPKSKIESELLYVDSNIKFRLNLELPNEHNPHYWTESKIFNIDYGINDGLITNYIIEYGLNPIDISRVNDGSLIIGYNQSESHMLKYRESIVNDWLKFNADLINRGVEYLFRFNPNEYCYVHFRGGDYTKIPNFYLPIGYYKKAIDTIKKYNPTLKFLIITDDLIEGKKLFNEYEVINNSEDIDFYLLANAKFSIISNSSFSWWASWLNSHKIVTIAPDNWFNYNGYYGNGFYPKSIKTESLTYIHHESNHVINELA
jgi:hypothetical protein